MNVTYLTLPVFMALIIGFATQLEDIAQDSADKAVAFSDDMNKAMECATKGVHISVCSPELTTYDFTPEQEAYLATLNDMQETLTNITIVDENNVTVEI